jgi:hypothetical protein
MSGSQTSFAQGQGQGQGRGKAKAKVGTAGHRTPAPPEPACTPSSACCVTAPAVDRLLGRAAQPVLPARKARRRAHGEFEYRCVKRDPASAIASSLGDTGPNSASRPP